MNKSSIHIKKDFSSLDFNDDWSFSNRGHEPYSHNYHRYPAKFIGPLAARLIQDESEERDLVCDTFGGCGTTLLEAKLLGRRSIGFDINPVAKFITEAKSKAIKPEKLEVALEKLTIRIGATQDIHNDYGCTHKRIQYWFSEDNYLTLSCIYQAILEEQNQAIQKFFLCAFSHCLKNSSRWLMKSIKPTIDKQKPSVDIIRLFIRHLRGMVKKNNLLYHRLKVDRRLSLESSIYLRDITKLDKKLQVDLVVTSPPYVISYEYGDLHQLTLLWFGQKKYKKWQYYSDDFTAFKSQFIGSSIRIETNNDMGSDIAEDIVHSLCQIDRVLSNKVNTYFCRMYQSFKVMYELLKQGKKACIVIGNTRFKDVPILNAEVAFQQLLKVGFNTDEVIKRSANERKLITPYRNKKTGKFTAKKSRNKTIAYHEEYILKMKK